jgi:uncharacterized tellurite resistance protein B-like protein
LEECPDMSLARFENILKTFRTSGELSSKEKQELFREVVLMTLARATSADYNIKRVEIETVQRIVREITDVEVSADDVSVAANSHMFEKEPLESYLSGVGRKIDGWQRALLLKNLADVIRSDEQTNLSESKYFDMVARALDATPSEIAGFVPKES